MLLGPIMGDLRTTVLQPEEREYLQHPLIGGVILFERNYASPEQLTELVTAIHSLRSPALLVAVDHEGGRVQRFQQGFTRLPPASMFGKVYQAAPAKACQLVRETAWVMAKELLGCGVDFSFAPVLDIGRGGSSVLVDRAFARLPDVVSTLGQQWLIGAHQAGMAIVGKHFPGHGGVSADSHTEMPVDQRSYEDLYMEDMRPFIHLINARMAGIMPAHIVFPQIDSHPVGFSMRWLQDILRKELGFVGAIFSDDIDMKGAHVDDSYPQRARLALASGCDMVLLCNNPEQLHRVLLELPQSIQPVSQPRLLRMHAAAAAMPLAILQQQSRWSDAVAKIEAIMDKYA